MSCVPAFYFSIKSGWWILSDVSPFDILIIWYHSLILQSVNMVDYPDRFLNVGTGLHSWKKPHVVLSIFLFIYCWIQFANILLRTLAVFKILVLSLKCFSLVLILGCCWHLNELGITIPSIFWKRLYKIGILSFLKLDLESSLLEGFYLQIQFFY